MTISMKAKYVLTMSWIIAIGVFVGLLAEIMGIKDHPEIWSTGYVITFNIVSKLIGIVVCLTGAYFLICRSPKDSK